VTLQEALSKNLIAHRKRLGLTQAALAQRAGISTHTVIQLERQNVWVGVETAAKLAGALGISSAALFADDSPTFEPVVLREDHESEVKALRAQLEKFQTEAKTLRDAVRLLLTERQWEILDRFEGFTDHELAIAERMARASRSGRESVRVERSPKKRRA